MLKDVYLLISSFVLLVTLSYVQHSCRVNLTVVGHNTLIIHDHTNNYCVDKTKVKTLVLDNNNQSIQIGSKYDIDVTIGSSPHGLACSSIA